MRALRRYEILLPLRFNDGLSVPDALLGQTVVDTRESREFFRDFKEQIKERFEQLEFT